MTPDFAPRRSLPTMSGAVHVSAPCRLHFGLLRAAHTEGPAFGGLGLMLAAPRVELTASAAPDWQITGPQRERVAAIARAALAQAPRERRPDALHIHVAELPPLHHGLGVGTQLALAVAAAVRQLAGLPPAEASTLAAVAGRGARSAIGSHGFVHGGLIWECGRRPPDRLAPLADRVALPEAWRVLLVTPGDPAGLSGVAERDAFAALEPTPPAAVEELTSLAEGQILPAARAGDLESFGEGVYRYGRRSGELFASVQGGVYATPAICRCVAALRSLGIAGVGQSSWGPTVFAVVQSAAAAREAADALAVRGAAAAIQAAAVDNRGAVLTPDP